MTNERMEYHKLQYTLEDSENPSLEMRRAKQKADKIFYELEQMTSNLPNDLQREKFFTPTRIQTLVAQILNGNIKGLHSRANNKQIFRGNEEHDNKFNSARLQHASLLVLEAIRVYQEYSENNLPQTDANIEAIAKLKEAQKLCSQLGATRVKSKRMTVKYNLLQEKKEGSN